MVLKKCLNCRNIGTKRKLCSVHNGKRKETVKHYCEFFEGGKKSLDEENDEEIACSCNNFYPNEGTIRWMGMHGMLNPGNSSLYNILGKNYK